MVSATAAFLLRPDKVDAFSLDHVEVEDEEADIPRGVLGLTSLNREAAAGSGIVGFGSVTAERGVPFAAAGAAAAAPVAPGEFVLEDEEDGAGAGRVSPRLAEELSWACAQVTDCGAQGVAVFDSDGELLWTDGDMVDPVPEDSAGGAFVGHVRNGGEKIVTEGKGVSDVPACFSGDVRTMVGLPIGESGAEGCGAVMVIGSENEGFYGSRQDRICLAVVQRLQLFFFTDTFKGSTSA